jgi:hypothetical protein
MSMVNPSGYWGAFKSIDHNGTKIEIANRTEHAIRKSRDMPFMVIPFNSVEKRSRQHHFA